MAAGWNLGRTLATDEQIRAQWQRLMDEEPELTQSRAAAEIGISMPTLRRYARRLGLASLRPGARTQRGREINAINARRNIAVYLASERAKGWPSLRRLRDDQEKITDAQVERARAEIISDPTASIAAIARDLGVTNHTLGVRLGIWSYGRAGYVHPARIQRKPNPNLIFSNYPKAA